MDVRREQARVVIHPDGQTLKGCKAAGVESVDTSARHTLKPEDPVLAILSWYNRTGVPGTLFFIRRWRFNSWA